MNSDSHKPEHHYNPLNLLSGGPPKEPRSGLITALSTISVFVLIPVIIAFFLTAFVIQSYQVDGESMESTLQNHDRLIVSKLPRTWSRITGHSYVPKRGDIIVFNQTGLPDSIYQKQLIKRVIGLPGERVLIKDGHITVFNSAHPEGFNPDTTGSYKITEPTYTNGPAEITLGNNEIFVCGDNRTNSEDSRYFGPINVSSVVGKLELRIMPLGKAETF